MRKSKIKWFHIFLILFAITFSSHAAPPHPRLLLQRMEMALQPMMSVMGMSSALSDPDIPKEGYRPQPDGIEYILVLRIDFSDQPGEKLASEFDKAIFGTDGTSMRLYFEEVSYGQMAILPGYLNGVMPSGKSWYRAKNRMSYYGSGTLIAPRYREMAEEACAAADADVDFSKYDRDGDGYVDHLMIIHAGDDEASTGVSNDIWSAVIDGLSGIYDGMRISSAIIVAEDPSNEAIDIGIYCHEFFHEFGAPDLYAWDYPVGHWCLMGTFGPYQDNGQHPCHISGYLKWDFDADPWNGVTGWLEPTTIASHGTYSVDSFELPTGNRLYKVDIPQKMGREYFLIENRNKRSGTIYDTHIPESGIVIWHIDENQPKSFGYPHRAWVEDPSDPDHNKSREATAGAAYSSDDGQSSFTLATLPDSNANDGTPSGIIITDIGPEGMSMPFTLFSGDTYEPNDSIAEAYGPLVYGKQYVSFVQDERDVDYYKFHSNADSNILVYLENIPEGCNYNLQIFDPQGNLISTSTEPDQMVKVLNFRTYTAGLYSLAVVSKSGYSSSQPYYLTVDSAPMAPGIIADAKVYPNPGPGNGGNVCFEYKLLTPVEKITLSIYTLAGTLIYTNSTSVAIRSGKLFWDAMTESGKRIASGVYIYVLKADVDGESDIRTGKIAIVY